jgi:pteridine reductase
MTSPAPVFLITGAARRVGAAIARALHAAGANVVVHCNRSRSEGEALVKSLNDLRPKSAHLVQGDLLATNALKGLVEHAASAWGRLDGLVNNASSFYATPVGSINEDMWLDLIDTNLKAPLFLCQAALPHLRKTRGAIVNLADVHAERPLKNFPVYGIAKAGLVGLTRALAVEFAPDVRVNAIAPGAIAWPEHGNDFPAAERERIVQQTPLQRIGSPDDIAQAAKMLLLDATFVTGQVLAVDGGRQLAL